MRRPDLKAFVLGCVIALVAAVLTMGIIYHGEFYHYRDVIDAWRAQALGGHLSYAFGSTFKQGRWYFYPAVAAVKTPVGVFLALAVTAGVMLYRRRTVPDSYVVILPAAVYAIACILSPVDLGVRILLPIYPLLYAFIALNLSDRRWKTALALCAAVVVIESVAIYPYYLAYFNTFSGGPTQGPRYLLDSNIDWGQDTKRLKSYLRERGAEWGLHRIFWSGISLLLRDRGVTMAWIRQSQQRTVVRLSRCSERDVALRRLRNRWPNLGVVAFRTS